VNKESYFIDKLEKSYHGTGDIFSSLIVANILNKVDIKNNLIDAVDFVANSIKETMNDDTHKYGVKFEKVLMKKKL
jgi:pyridoxine kinase